MKRFGLFLFVLLVMVSAVFSETFVSGDSTTIKSGAGATLPYSLNLSNVDSVEIGFSGMPVNSLDASRTEVSMTGSEFILTAQNGKFIAEHTANLYVYWKIHTTNNLKVKLEVSSLVNSGNYINVNVTHTPDEGGDTTLISGTISTTNATNATLDELFSFDTVTFNDHQAAGCHQLKLVSENFKDKPVGKYTGTLTLTITAG